VIRDVRILRRAFGDLEAIQRYVERDRPEAARLLIVRLLDAAESLSENPDRGARPKDGRLRGLAYRFLVVSGYLLFYKVTPRTVRIYRVIHGQRRYEAVL
jgi:plasmid stabilization system protein ParE